jgi:hypothetical protein
MLTCHKMGQTTVGGAFDQPAPLETPAGAGDVGTVPESTSDPEEGN